MQQATDGTVVEIKLIQSVVASTDLAENEVRAGMTWVDQAMMHSHFNMYHEFDKVVGHIRLATSVSLDTIDFSLKAHRFQPLPSNYPADHMLFVVATILANKDALREYVNGLPTF